MTQLDFATVYVLARNAGFDPPHAVVATAIAFAESGGRTDAVGDVALQTSKWGPSIGLWQVRSLRADQGTGRTRDASRLTNPEFNAKSAYTIAGGGQNFGAWTTYVNGTYRAHLTPATQAGTTTEKQAGGSDGWLDRLGDLVGAGAGAAAGVVTNPVKAVLSVGDFLAKLADPHLWMRVVMVAGGLTALVVGALLLKGDLTAEAVGSLTGAGKGAAIGGLASKAATAAL